MASSPLRQQLGVECTHHIELTATPGQVLEFGLPERPGTGTIWGKGEGYRAAPIRETPPPAAVPPVDLVVGERFTANNPDPHVMGAGGIHTYRIQAPAEPGDYVQYFVSGRPWLKEQAATAQLLLHVVAAEGGSM